MKFSRPRPIWSWSLLLALWVAVIFLLFRLAMSGPSTGLLGALYGVFWVLGIVGFMGAPFLLLPRPWANLMAGVALLAWSGFYVVMAQVTTGLPLLLLFAPPLVSALCFSAALRKLPLYGKAIAALGLALCTWAVIEGVIARFDGRGPQL